MKLEELVYRTAIYKLYIIVGYCKISIRDSFSRGTRTVRVSVILRIGQIRVATDLSRVAYLSPILFYFKFYVGGKVGIKWITLFGNV